MCVYCIYVYYTSQVRKRIEKTDERDQRALHNIYNNVYNMYVQPCIHVPIYSTRGRFLRRTGSSVECVKVKEVPTTYVINFSINSVYMPLLRRYSRNNINFIRYPSANTQL